VTFGPDGTRLVSGDANGTAILWNTDSQYTLAEVQLPVGANAVAFSPDGTAAAIACEDGLVRLWTAPGGGQGAADDFLSSDGSPVLDVAWAREAELVATGSADGHVRLWNPITRQVIRTFDLP